MKTEIATQAEIEEQLLQLSKSWNTLLSSMSDPQKMLYANLLNDLAVGTIEVLDKLQEKLKPQDPEKKAIMEVWKKQNPTWSAEQLEAKYEKSASIIKEIKQKQELNLKRSKK